MALTEVAKIGISKQSPEPKIASDPRRRHDMRNAARRQCPVCYAALASNVGRMKTGVLATFP